MKIDGEVCREYMLSKYDNHPYIDSYLIKLIIHEFEAEEIDRIELNGEFIQVFMKPGGNHIYWNIEYTEYCKFVNEKRQQKLERILNAI